MDNPVRERGERRQLADEAAEWLFRLEAASPEERRAFVRWLKRSKDAPDEVLLAKSTDILLRQLLRDRPVDLAEFSLGTNNVTPLPVDLDPATPAPLFSSPQSGEGPPSSSSEIALAIEAKNRVRGRRRAWIGGVGVSIAAAIALLMIEPPFVSQWLHPDVYRTSIGEQRAIELTDGSAISINAKSSVRVKFTERARDVYLNAGQAMFTVAKDADRPFRVHVGDTVVQAIGTKFDVRRGTDRINVAVVEGTVQITTDAASRTESALATLVAATRVTAGEGVSVADAGRVTPPTPINVADVSAWQQRRLVFANNTLAEIAEEFARFNRTPHLRIEGEALRARRFSGVFDADAPEALLVYLSADDTIAFDHQGHEIVIMPRPIIVQSSGDAP